MVARPALSHRSPRPLQLPATPSPPPGRPPPLWPRLTPDQRRLMACLLADLLRRRLVRSPTPEEVPDE